MSRSSEARGADLTDGVYAALVTPFDAAGRIDGDGLDRLVEFYLGHGVHGLVVGSLIGEALALDADERAQAVGRVHARVRGRAPVLAGVCERVTGEACRTAQGAAEIGVAGLVVTPPLAAATGTDALVRSLQAIASAAGLPLVVLDYPALTGVTLDVPQLCGLVEEIDLVEGVKLEDAPTPPKIAQLRTAVGSRLRIYGASSGRYCIRELASGADGLMTGYAFPEDLVEIYERVRAGDESGATDLYRRSLPMIELEARSGAAIAARKELLRLRGVIEGAGVRPPTFQLDAGARAGVLATLESFRMLATPGQ